MAVTGLSAEDAERLRSFERRVHDAVSAGYYDFFTPITLLASEPLLDAAGLTQGMRLLDVASGPGSVAGAALRRGARPVGVDLSSRMVELARSLNPEVEFTRGGRRAPAVSRRSVRRAGVQLGLGISSRGGGRRMRVVKPGARRPSLVTCRASSASRACSGMRSRRAPLPAPDFPAGH
jgi:SAM-dependent methyltransferase